MHPIVTFTVSPNLPQPIGRLAELARNIYWSWNPTIRECLRSVAPELWHKSNHHPLKMFEALPPERLEELAVDEEFLQRYHRALAVFDSYRNGTGWYHQTRGASRMQGETIAYLSAEFGLHESIPLYSGGLGVLSGDHTKATSDLGLPFVCVGLMYQMGYFRQRLTTEGAQLESYDINALSLLPLNEVVDTTGLPLRITVDYPRGVVHARIWRLDVGRVPIYLLDTNIVENTIPEYHDIADNLYGGDQETRIMQEIMLGIGGLRALHALGIEPTVTHSNEGHSAFLMLERARNLMHELGLNFAEASELAAAGSIFTTHTPVPAGNDAFPPEMIERYFQSYWPQLGLSRDEFLSLGRIDPSDQNEPFSMTVLALKLTSKHNGVSQLHGLVSQKMWNGIWSNIPAPETPIIGITNGVHTQTWVADPMSDLFDRYLGADWRERISQQETWDRAADIADEELWSIKNGMRHDMVSFIHQRLDEQQAEWYSRSVRGRDRASILNPEALTIGFARRFATYKRATLIFRDPERALRLFTDQERPIQLVFAGKAHPKDIPGKEFIRKVIEFIRKHQLESKIVFIEDYDMAVGRRMTQGCDVWLNTPRRPLEASGTSGMKAAINGTLNLSVLDGWFPEGYDTTNAFAIGHGEEFADPEHQDEFESRLLYRLLEEQVIPAFYTRNKAGIPESWVAMQKRALITMAGTFSADRMVQDYATKFYFPVSDRFRDLRADGGARTRSLLQWKRVIADGWNGVRFVDTAVHARSTMKVGQQANVVARVELGVLGPDDIVVEAYYGAIDPNGLVGDGVPTRLQLSGVENGTATYTGSVQIERSGHAGIAIRALPWHPDLSDYRQLNVIRWAAES